MPDEVAQREGLSFYPVVFEMRIFFLRVQFFCMDLKILGDDFGFFSRKIQAKRINFSSKDVWGHS